METARNQWLSVGAQGTFDRGVDLTLSHAWMRLGPSIPDDSISRHFNVSVAGGGEKAHAKRAGADHHLSEGVCW